MIRSAAILFVLLFALACGDDAATGDAGAIDASAAADAGGAPPDGLPFEFERPESGKPPSAEEVTDFTRAITGFWKQTDYFGWVARLSHGLDASFDPEMPDYALWWQDARVEKTGDKVVFHQIGFSDNLMIRSSKMLVQASAGYLASGDETMGRLITDLSKGVVALFQGMAWAGQDPPVTSIMARAIFTHDHDYTTFDGHKARVEYGGVKGAACSDHDECPGEHADCPDEGAPSDGHTGGCCRGGVCVTLHWNSHTVPNPDNPFFGDIWVRNMRSKDDVPHIFRTVPWLRRVAREADDDAVRDAAARAVEHLEAFGNDIVDSGYQIRTTEDGMSYVPTQDLASFVRYDAALPNGECTAKISAALVGRGEPLDNDCGPGMDELFESIATGSNYYNFAILWYFHLSALANALDTGADDAAEALLKGLAVRIDALMADDETRVDNPEFDADLASFLLASAATGLPLTGDEARKIQEQYLAALPYYEDWGLWNLWDSEVPDGDHPYTPSRADGETRYVQVTELGYLLEYCMSPWRTDAGPPLVDCEIILDPSRWGE